MRTDPPGESLLEDDLDIDLTWMVASAACDMVGISLSQLLSYGQTDEWPEDERVLGIWLAFGPPLLRDADGIAADLERRAVSSAP